MYLRQDLFTLLLYFIVGMSNVETTDINTNTDDSNTVSKAFTPPPGYEKMSLLAEPLKFSGVVTKGFQRGSKLLGIPTANIPIDNPDNKQQKEDVEELGTGIYFGWAKLFKNKEALVNNSKNDDEDDDDFVNVTYKTVVSIGWNPYFKNKEKTIEPYIMHEFAEDFYGYYLQILLCGYLRPELDFTTMENLKKAIHDDIDLSKSLLNQSPYKEFQNDLDNNKM